VRLYHYTTGTGLEGIIDSKTIWLTDIEYLNDLSEFKHFIEITREEFEKELAAEVFSDKQHENMNNVLDHCFNSYKQTRIYVASFSKDGDSLSQWRVYSGSRGYNIGFEKEEIIEQLELKNSGDDTRSVLLEVNYNKKETVKAANRFVRSLIGSEKVGQLNDLDSIPLLYDEFCKLAATHKNEGFSDEQEWRFISVGRFHRPGIGTVPLKIRSSNGSFIPFIKLGIMNNQSNRLSACSVRVGPGHDHELQESALKRFFADNPETSHIAVDSSPIPFQPWR